MPVRAGRIPILLILMLLTLLLSTPLAARATDRHWPDCTVEMLDGTVHEHVDVAWKLDGFLIRLTTVDRVEINLKPREIARIYDAEGRHITQEVADASPSPGDPGGLGDHQHLPLDLGLSGDVGGSAGFTRGYGGMVFSGAWFAGARYAFAERWHVRAQYRSQYLREHVPDRLDAADVWTDEVSLLLGFQPIHPRRNRNFTYLELGPVLVNWRQRYDKEADTFKTGGAPGLGGLLRGGVLIPVSSSLAIDVGGLLSVRPPLVDGADTLGTVFGLNVALAVY
jgi:hypothetical protein